MKLTRRTFLEAIIVSATVEACSSSDASAPAGPALENGAAYFPQSVASGDPTPDSVVLWTRVDDPAAAGDREVLLEVATDADFAVVVAREARLACLAAHDHAVKIKLTGLSPRTRYYYRFVYDTGGRRYASKVGRTKTAPLATDDVPVKFVVASCQDFTGRYYNAWQHLVSLDLDLDCVVFLGDYVYETTGSPESGTTAARAVTLSDPASALQRGTPASPALAAQSLSNYRDLYKTFRSDTFLQQVHERHPFVFVWDDHEYSDDCHGATSTYSAGLSDETNVARRRNAEQVYFEYIPFALPDRVAGPIDVESLPKFPDTRIYRDLGFGKHLRLLVADHRTYRPDHLVPEDAYPAAIVMPEEALRAANLTGQFASDQFAYVDIDAPEYAIQKVLLSLAYQQMAREAGLDKSAAEEKAALVVKGPLALFYVNAVLTNPTLGLAPIDPSGKPRGLAWVHMGKRDPFAAAPGARYVVVKDAYDAYAAYQYAATEGKNQDVHGPLQTAWLEGALGASETWKVLVSSVSMTSMVFDLREKTDLPDPFLRNRFYLNVDQWDGFPDRRRALLDKLAAPSAGKTMVVSGDIHASFASVEHGVPCLTSPAISSQSVRSGAAGIASALQFDPSTPIYRYVVTDIDASFAAGNPGIVFSDSDSHGFLLVELQADGAKATFHLIPSAEVNTSYAVRPADLRAKVTTKTMNVTPGSITGA